MQGLPPLQPRTERRRMVWAHTGRLLSDMAKQAFSIADIEGPWVEPQFASSLIDRCRSGWNTPVGELTNELLATYLRQKIATRLIVPEARRRIAERCVDGTELYEEELAEALRFATGEG